MIESVTLVVPVLNEAESLPALLEGVEAQRYRPAEIVVTDSGSTDGSADIVRRWWAERGWAGARCRVLSHPGGMPGSNRNAGIRAATSEWIAFLDAGTVPEPDWLEKLKDCAEGTGSMGVFGLCQFHADGVVDRAICALSYGYLASQPVLPASLFNREVFDRVGLFEERLRAAEDILWMQRYVAAYGERQVCEAARVHYRQFPHTLVAAMRKWYVNQQNTVRAGVRRTQQVLYPAATLALLALLAFSPLAGLSAAAVYLVARGIADPARRSGDLFWWQGAAPAFFLAIAAAPCLDLAKTAAILSTAFREVKG